MALPGAIHRCLPTGSTGRSKSLPLVFKFSHQRDVLLPRDLALAGKMSTHKVVAASGSHPDSLPANDHTGRHTSSVISLTNSEPGPDIANDHHAPSVISLTDSEPNIAIDHRRSPSVISLTDSEHDSQHNASIIPPSISALGALGRSNHCIHYSPSIIFLTDSQPHADVNPLPVIPLYQHQPNVREAVDPLSGGDTPTNPIEVERVRVWPADFAVADIAEFFTLCQRLTHRPWVRRVFTWRFQVPFVAATYHRTRQILEDPAHHHLRQRFIEYGHANQGMWSIFVLEARRAAHA
ncbi:hypothetical protein OG21DRAFT_1516998 [Imleria badia]|nr:hypothetical protein OG21DRAFT_1516998 [Imleria badia]